LDVLYDYGKISNVLNAETLRRRPYNQWRYRELLPIESNSFLPPLHIGWTPIHEAPRLAELVGVSRIYLKDDGRNPTASLKDRASSVGVIKALEFDYDAIACASTGNAASSLAGLAASIGLTSFIFIPESAPEPKVVQLLIFGATVVKVKGTYFDAFDLCMKACERYGWYNRNSGINPYLVEGKKTVGLEIAEQLGHDLPDWVVISVGDGCTVAGVCKGLAEMKRIGLIDRVPRMLGVQAEGARPIVDAFESKTELQPCTVNTMADSIAVGTPRNWRKAIKGIAKSGGAMISVTDEEILDAMCYTARVGGIFGEPAGVAGMAGLKKAASLGIIGRRESVLAVITGNGLKDIRSAKLAAGQAMLVSPDVDELDKKLGIMKSD
jgi:threonine synthase